MFNGQMGGVPIILAAVGHLRTADVIVLAVYLAGIVGLGCWLMRRSKTAEGFTTGNRSMAGWVVGLSIFGTYVSSISFLANPGKSYLGNWNPFVFGLGIPLAAWIATKWFVPFYRRGGSVSAFAHLEDRFGLWARWYAGICFVLMQLSRVGSILFLVALAVGQLTGWNTAGIIVGVGLLVVAYTMLGGIEAVIWTDVVQSIVLTVGALIALWILLSGSPEVAVHLREHASEKMSLGSLGASLTESTFWVVLIYGFFMNLNNFGIDQTYVQRYLAAKSDESAKRSVWLGGLMYLPVSALLFLVGTALFSYYQVHAHEMSAELAGRLAEGQDGDKVFPFFIATQMPAGIAGLLVAAILAAAMSSVDSSLNSSATLVLEDFVRRTGMGMSKSQKGELRVLHLATAIFGLLGIGVALAMMGVSSVLDTWWTLAGIFAGGVLGLFLLGMLVARVNARAAGIAAGCGVGLIVFLSLDANPLHKFLTVVIGTSAIVIIGFVLTVVLERGRGESR
jgi:SSS family solute:Na+ symporter